LIKSKEDSGAGDIPSPVTRLAVEEIGHEHLILMILVGRGENIGALDYLG
jgi:hypothetical protein